MNDDCYKIFLINKLLLSYEADVPSCPLLDTLEVKTNHCAAMRNEIVDMKTL